MDGHGQNNNPSPSAGDKNKLLQIIIQKLTIIFDYMYIFMLRFALEYKIIRVKLYSGDCVKHDKFPRFECKRVCINCVSKRVDSRFPNSHLNRFRGNACKTHFLPDFNEDVLTNK